MTDQPLYLVEVEAGIDAAGTKKTLRFGNRGYTTEPTDTPPNTTYLPNIAKDGTGSINRELFSGDRTYGSSRVGFGEILLVNTDGHLDDLLNFSFSNRPITVKTGDLEDPFSTLQTVLKATMSQVELSRTRVSIGIKDRQYELDQQHQTVVFAGNNVLPNGLEGLADLEGKPKPYLLGRVFNIAPPLVNTSRLIYQVNDGAINSLPAVYDGGFALTAGANYSSQADMEANAPAVGQYRVWLAGGYFRLGSSPVFEITCDAVAGSNTAARTTAQTLRNLALYRGIASGDINAADVTALDAASPAEVGIWFADERTTLQAMDEVSASAGAFFGFDRLGQLRLGQFGAPSGMPVAEINQINGFDLDKVSNADGQPTYRVTVNYAKFETVQTTSLAGAVTDDRRAQLAKEYRSFVAEDTGVQIQYLAAGEQLRDTLLTDASAAQVEANRLLNIYKVRRDVFKVTVRLTAATLLSIDLNAVVTLRWNRFGLDDGRLMRVIGGDFDYARNRATFTLWG